MTVCIAAICDKSKSVVVATDKMISAPFLAAEFEHPQGKITRLSSCCVGMSAGDALASTELFRILEAQISQLQAPTIDLIASRAKEMYGVARLGRAEDAILKPRGITAEAFYKQGLIGALPNDIAFGLDQAIRDSNFNLTVTVAGCDHLGGQIYGILDPGVLRCFDRVGYSAIGSGEAHAMLALAGSSHTVWIED